MRVLDGQELANAILAMLDEEVGLRCAVAFWGPAIARRARRRDATVILDLSMRGTTRNALKALGVRRKGVDEQTGSRVRVLDRLHAKVYLGRDVAIIGSANASANALGRDGGTPTLREAGVMISRATEPEAYEEAERIWQRLLIASRAVRPKDLDRAPLVAATAAARDVDQTQQTRPTSILDAVLHRPDDFRSTILIFGDHDISAPALEAAKRDFKAEHGEAPRKQDLICACSRNDEHDVTLRSALKVLMFWFGRQPGLYAYHDVVRTERKGRVSYFGRRDWPLVGPELGFEGVRKFQAWGTDRQNAERMCDIDGQPVKGRYVARSADATAAWLEAHPDAGM